MLSTRSTDPRILEAVKLTLMLFNDKKFTDLIANIPRYDMCDMSPSAMVAYAQRHLENNTVEVRTYKPFWRWSSAYAMFDPSKSVNAIYLSSRKLHRYNDHEENIASIVGSIVHELWHLFDWWCKPFSFGHGDNKPKGKEKTAPYLIGYLAKHHVLLNYF